MSSEGANILSSYVSSQVVIYLFVAWAVVLMLQGNIKEIYPVTFFLAMAGTYFIPLSWAVFFYDAYRSSKYRFVAPIFAVLVTQLCASSLTGYLVAHVMYGPLDEVPLAVTINFAFLRYTIPLFYLCFLAKILWDRRK